MVRKLLVDNLLHQYYTFEWLFIQMLSLSQPKNEAEKFLAINLSFHQRHWTAYVYTVSNELTSSLRSFGQNKYQSLYLVHIFPFIVNCIVITRSVAVALLMFASLDLFLVMFTQFIQMCNTGTN